MNQKKLKIGINRKLGIKFGIRKIVNRRNWESGEFEKLEMLKILNIKKSRLKLKQNYRLTNYKNNNKKTKS